MENGRKVDAAKRAFEDRQRKAKQEETAIQAVAATYAKPQPTDAQPPMGGLKIANPTPPKEGEGENIIQVA